MYLVEGCCVLCGVGWGGVGRLRRERQRADGETWLGKLLGFGGSGVVFVYLFVWEVGGREGGRASAR